MIIRQLALRQGRRSLAPQWRSARRWMSSEVDSISSSMQNSLNETHSIESMLNSLPGERVQPIDDETHQTADTENIGTVFAEFKRQRELQKPLGAIVTPHYEPHTLVTNPPRPSDISLELLLASQAHMGHSTSLWNPGNARYIFGIRDGIHIISLDQTAAHLRRAARVVTAVAERAGLILFVGTRPGQDRAVVKAAELSGGCHLFDRWVAGGITNGTQILGRGKVKVVDEFDQEVPGFEEQLVERASVKPDLVVCLNPMENYVLLHECALNNIPTIGIIDTNANPLWVTYPIPANDDSLRCVQVICGILGRAGEEGKTRRLAAAQAGNITFTPADGFVMPGEEKTEQQKLPRVLKLGASIEELEKQDAMGNRPLKKDPLPRNFIEGEVRERVPRFHDAKKDL
ncbi:ribosomal protein S2 [Trichodelitschia bisporula]|uniref:Ribosomal protein S2 n=1 Tax=Trichodelitschia bisporula TaxID=703511 RepID=A0A6G1HW78_9PEZI|nr:ribosomal protein S2 [Trichodelitschia bisporula]